jgi:hypothetical protein
MLKKALEYIVSMNAPTVEYIDGQTYTDRELSRISYNPKASEIEMHTLSSLVEYIRKNVDTMSDKMVVHVKSPTNVSLYSKLDHERKREYMVNVKAAIPDFNFGQFLEHESFCINLQSKFLDTVDRALILKFAGTVEAGSVSEYGDDGVTQKATIKTGIASKGDAIVPSPAMLIPYRTFIEVEQPASSFIFRMKQQRDGEIVCALFEADGGAWRIEAMQNITAYLKEALKDLDAFVVIS